MRDGNRARLSRPCVAAMLALLVASCATNPVATPSTTSFALVHDPFCLDGCPQKDKTADNLIRHSRYELMYNAKTKFADWVAYKITNTSWAEHCNRPFGSDPLLLELAKQAEIDPPLTVADYSGIRSALASDRGHQAPLAALCRNAEKELCYLSNITPQKSALNEGAWKKLEAAELGLVKHHGIGAVYSLTGTLYERRLPGLPHTNAKHQIPSGYWKVIAVADAGAMQVVGFAMDQTTSSGFDYCQAQVSLDDIERRAKLRLFPGLSDAQRHALANGSTQAGLLKLLGCRAVNA